MNLMSQWYGQKPWQLRYTLAVVTVGLSLLLTLLLRQILHTTPSLLFFAAVMFSSWYGGIGPGLLATVLSIFSISYFLLSPVFALSYALTDILLLGVFTLVALLTSWLNTARMQVEEKLRQSEQQSRATFNQAAVGIAHVAKMDSGYGSIKSFAILSVTHLRNC
jgi:K+-sensing histidine kinase KdpD